MEDFITFIGRFHPLWVHLPIGFLLIAVLLKGYADFLKRPALQEAVRFSLGLGAVSALIAAFLGFLLSRSGGYEGDILDIHLASGWITVALSGLAWWINKNEGKFSNKLNYAVLTVLVFTLFVTGHFGGSLTHGEDYLSAYAPFGDNQEENAVPVLAKIEDAEVYRDLIQPVMKSKCQSCHRVGKTKGELNLTSYESLLKGGKNGPVIVPSASDKSELIRRVLLPGDHKDYMPAEGKKPLTEEEIHLIRWWIDQGNADPNISLMDADAKLIDWAKSRLVLEGSEQTDLARMDTAGIQQLEKLGFRIRVLSPETGELDVVLPGESTNGQSGGLLKELMPFKDQIIWLSVAGTGIRDAEIALIAQFSNLRRLRIENNPITDRGISALSGLTKLEVLNLNGTQVSALGVESIARISSLKSLYLWNTPIDPLDERLQKLAANNVKVTVGS